MSQLLDRLRTDAVAIYAAAVAGVEPRRAVTRAFATTPPPNPSHIIALGKAAYPMAAAAVQHFDRLEVPIQGGLVVTPDVGDSPDPRLRRVTGDHPVPGTRSRAAAAALQDALAAVNYRDEVWVLISGGTSSLVGAPVDGMSEIEYDLLMRALARAGLPVAALNRARKRFSRWGAGRLVSAGRGDRIRVFLLSDVPGDDPADIGSGPCAPDPSSAAEILALLDALGSEAGVPDAALRYLERTIRGIVPETPKPGDPVFERVTTRLVGSNALALDHAEERARALGYEVRRHPTPVTGEAGTVGRELIRSILADDPTPGTAWIGGGETTVSLGPDHGLGGRCQELALAAAGELAPYRNRRRVTLLAGGTDGRDGPTDAAGAVVDSRTWDAIREAGLDPDRALARHDAHPALTAAGALLRPGLTGTNVMDVMVVLVGDRPNLRAAGDQPESDNPHQAGS